MMPFLTDMGNCPCLSSSSTKQPASTKKAFFVEAGCFVDEDDRQGQLPISVRKGIMMEGDPGTSSRFLARSVRLYAPKRELKSVTTSYHQLVDGD